MSEKINKGINRDIAVKIAMMLDLPDILSLCRTNQKFNKYVCENKYFWVKLLKYNFGIYGHHDIINFDVSARTYYKIVNKISKIGIENIFFNSVKRGNIIPLRITLRDTRLKSGLLVEGLKIAIKKGYINITKLLLDKIREKYKDDYRTVYVVINDEFLEAIKYYRYEIVKLLLEYPEINSNPDTLTNGFFLAIKQPNNKIAELLLSYPAINSNSDTLSLGLLLATDKDNKYLFDLFLKNPVTQIGKSFTQAVILNHHYFVNRLFNDPRTDTSLTDEFINYLTYDKNPYGNKLIIQLLRQGKRLNDIKFLLWAVRNDHLDIVKILVDEYSVEPTYSVVQISKQYPEIYDYLMKNPNTPENIKNMFNNNNNNIITMKNLPKLNYYK